MLAVFKNTIDWLSRLVEKDGSIFHPSPFYHSVLRLNLEVVKRTYKH
jgi:NAD(P)H-dependent FMN reductase